MKWFIRILAVLAVIIVVLLWFGFSQIGRIVRLGMETVGTELLGVTVKLEKADGALLSGSGSFEGLEIGNPSGFQGAYAIRAAKIAARMPSWYSGTFTSPAWM